MELRVKDICKEKGILFKELAEKLNVSDIGLRASLKGNPTIGTLEKIAEALGVPFTELFERPKSDTASLTCPNCGKNINIKVE
ncbi:helix-turn-helix domain-containing protein [Bacteroides cellulosilyticus]|uniref:helix-turn-helix domain-containing protein n=1 Tax=Bacteroides cellulosilyticus TaxID=246787 RepID=UPI001C378E7B|nr:helix-turn-helix transcriptional regulator [Bacteroides cellulosilyticus]MBV3636729.1 helix-turn-helix domain-containing protein [Bacteroides cellulosilyticus]MBV3663044.1 helix-turn-helix domain-containing protein [Bacteroides cellulosilyticus]MBV3685165.1 helix-turn-helix domain-containing protein [Bacteroides cellulosilyticus]MBV3693731.1 helix-turn-helix domain-containing protein [Bacteroides cellulosilyticus]MBV3707218.1 helix-turn-helix domain-containing protein [Bacteroides cellulosi